MTKTKEHRVYVALGSNLGHRQAYLQDALAMITAHPDIVVRSVAKVIESAPVGGPVQGPYLNTVACVVTGLSPHVLLEIFLGIEKELSRVRKERFGPRTIDIDILSYDDHVIDEEGLQIPHPRMHLRDFVLGPLREIAPDWQHPQSGESIEHLWQTARTQLKTYRPADNPGNALAKDDEDEASAAGLAQTASAFSV